MLRRVRTLILQHFLKRFSGLITYLARRRGLWLRALIVWLIGCIALSNDEITSYDKRFKLRGDQKASEEIIIINLRQSDFANIYDVRTNFLNNITEATDITDSFYWNKNIWTELLTRILAQQPKSVGVALYFGDNIGNININSFESQVFQDPRIFWASTTTSMERLLVPTFSNSEFTNIGINELRRDEDGVIRRVFPQRFEIPHLAEKVTGKNFPTKLAGLPINYQGSSKIFKQYSLSEIFYEEIPKNALKDKIILIGAETNQATTFLTPLGALSRVEIIAHAADNLIGNKWIKKLPFFYYAAGFFVLVIVALFMITTYPQSVALFFILWIGTLLAALSAWVFDTFYFWSPAFSPFILLVTAWVIFIGYQASKVERKNIRLQQEQEYLAELEQLKNNFVSLISHDLKTPIAKIQAVVDRLLTQNQNNEINQDLKSLRLFSDELNRYIQSILKVLRVESREFKINKEVADINESIEECLAMVQPLAHEKQVAIQSQLEPLFSLEYDTTLIKEVILNLIENAIKYTASGGQIKVISEEIEDFIKVTIIDNGEGIRPEDLDKVWGKFTRGSDQDLKTKGSGLGLYLVKYFIELHGGRVNMTSILGQGTTVSFTLPLESEEEEDEVLS